MADYTLHRDAPLGVNMLPLFSAPYPERNDPCTCPEDKRLCAHCRAWQRTHPPTVTGSEYQAKGKNEQRAVARSEDEA